MTLILLALGLGLAAAVGLRWFAFTPPARILSDGRRTLGMLVLLLAAGLAVTGRIGFAVPLAGVGLSLVGAGLPSLRRRTHRSPGSRSTVESPALRMTLDHESGAMAGLVRRGRFSGRELDSLGDTELTALRAELASDGDSRALLEAYLDRRTPGWREDVERDTARRGAGTPHSGAMSDQEAYEILGLGEGAGEADVRAAYRRLMKGVHPDQGGSAYLAARINAAKDRLLQGHR